MHYFVAEMVPLVVLLPLDEVTKFEIPIEEETTATSTDLELEVLGGINNDATDPKGKGKKRTRSSLRLKALSSSIWKY